MCLGLLFYSCSSDDATSEVSNPDGESPLSSFEWIQTGADMYGKTGDNLGTQISLNADGTMLAAGSRSSDLNGSNSGNLRIFQNLNNEWTQLGTTIPGAHFGNEFGTSVSISEDGTTVAAGGCDCSAQANRSSRGQARVYKFDGANWNQTGVFDGENPGDRYGSSISLNADGTIVAIGSPYNNGGFEGNSDAGHVRVFEYDGVSWNQLGNDINGEGIIDGLGNAISLSADGTIIAIGSSNKLHNSLEKVGEVNIYRFINSEWTKIGNPIVGSNLRDQFGYSVSISSDGNMVAIGAPESDITQTENNQGYVRIFRNTGDSWTQIGSDLRGENSRDFFGQVVSISGNGTTVSIGAVGYDGVDGTMENSGYTKVYRLNNGNWALIGDAILGEAAIDNAGNAVSLNSNGEILAIAAHFNDNNGNGSGQLKVFKLEPK